MHLKSSQKIIIGNGHDLNKIKAIIKSKNPEILVLEPENASLNLKINALAYKLVMDDDWIGIETKQIKRKRGGSNKLLRIALINHRDDKYRLRRADAEVAKNPEQVIQ